MSNGLKLQQTKKYTENESKKKKKMEQSNQED